MRSAKSLYICYFGVREPLVQTQVLPYLRELVAGGHELTLLTFEPDLKAKWTSEQIDEMRERLAADGIAWHCLAYHKWPSAPATAWDVLAGAFRVRRLMRETEFDILHCRAHVPGLMAALARKFSRRQRPKLLFDIRGFFPEEYTDAGVWPEGGILYRSAKRVERWLLKQADGFVVLTEKARDILFPEMKGSSVVDADATDKLGRPVEVIPCCVDLDKRFSGDAAELRRRTRARLNLDGRRVILHLGALGGLYLTEEIADLLAEARARDVGTFAMFLTQSDPQKIVPLLERRGFSSDDYFVERVPAAEIQPYLEAADIGLSIVKASFATQSRSPTKIPEYLACGLPIIANRGVGDVDPLIEDNRVGVILDEFSPAGYAKALSEIEKLGDIGNRCRETARREFDLKTVGGRRYRRAYERISAPTGSSSGHAG